MNNCMAFSISSKLKFIFICNNNNNNSNDQFFSPAALTNIFLMINKIEIM